MASQRDFVITRNPRGRGFVVDGVFVDQKFHHMGYVVENGIPQGAVPETVVGQHHYYPSHVERGLLMGEFLQCFPECLPIIGPMPGIEFVGMDADVMATYNIL